MKVRLTRPPPLTPLGLVRVVQRCMRHGAQDLVMVKGDAPIGAPLRETATA